MKLIVEVPEKIYNTIDDDMYVSKGQLDVLQRCIREGVYVPDNVSLLSVTEFADKCRECGAKNFIRIPDNATNGDVIKTLFSHYDIEIDEHKEYVRVFYENFYTTYPMRWWKAPYKKGGTDEM